MRFIATIFQWSVVFCGLCGAFFLLPQCLVTILSFISYAFLSFCIGLWINELAEDYFFQAKVEVKNKAVLITGCDSGFGHELAKILDKRGYHVFACCYDSLGDGASDLKDVCTSRLKVVQMDVTKDESVEKALKVVENSLGKTELWAIVNNAGIMKGFQTEFSSMTDYDDCIQVNTLGMIRVTKAYLPLLRQSKGRVVNICSLSGRFRCQYLGPYAISKAAAVVFTDLLRQEMREFGMRVISIEPEFFKTPMCSDTYTQNVLDQSLAHVNEEIKSAYGSRYIQKARQLYLFIFSHSGRNVKRVLGAIEAAVSLQNPADVYKPCRNTPLKLMFFLGERVQIVFVDILLMIIYFAMGLPPPKSGVGYISRFLKM